jgi:cyclohexanone monooxygenase
VQEVRRLSGIGQHFYQECTPGYYNSEGAPGNKNGFFAESYGAGSLIFFDMLDKWRNDDKLDGLSLR